MAVLEEGEREALKSVDDSLRQIQRSLEEAARSGAIDEVTIQRLAQTAKEAARRANENLPGLIDAQAADEIRRRLIGILTLNLEQLSSLDVADRFLMEMEAVRHVVRDILEEQPPVELRDAGNVVRLLEEWLPSLSVSDLAALLGLSPRQLQRRRAEGGESTHRLEIVARLVAILRHSWTDNGVAAWFYRAQSRLNGQQPIELLDDAQHERDLLMAARAGRVQGGA